MVVIDDLGVERRPPRKNIFKKGLALLLVLCYIIGVEDMHQMTSGKMYERVSKWVEKQYPAYDDSAYEVSMNVLDNWYLEVNVYTEEKQYQCFITVPEVGRKAIVVEDIAEYKRYY